MRSSAFGSTAIGVACGLPSAAGRRRAPPGCCPATRSRRASFLPNVSRFTASSLASIPSVLAARAGARAVRPPPARGHVYTNNDDTDVSSWMLRMAWPSSRATDSTTIFLHAAFSAVERNRVGHDQPVDRRLLDALDRRARQHAVHRARRARARRRSPSSACAAFCIVPAVSMMSSWMMQVAPLHVADHVHHLRRAHRPARAACR